MSLHPTTSSAKVQLHGVTREQILALGSGPAAQDMFDGQGLTNPYGVLVSERVPHAQRVADVLENPEHVIWYYRLIVVDGRIVGSISFHSPPDEFGMLEIGLGIAEPERGHGYATSAVALMWDWAATQPDVKTLRYCVSPDNAASQAIIRKFPVTKIGVQIDEEDGPEDIYEISAMDYREFRATATGASLS